MDFSKTIIPKSDQLNFEDVQSQNITAVIKSVRAGNTEQPVFIDLDGYEGRPYKPSKSMRRVLIGGWGADGHAWVGRSITITGDPSVKFGGVAVGGIKIYAMSDVEADFSMMLSTSRGKRSEHRVRKLETRNRTPQPAEPDRSQDDILKGFTEAAGKANDVETLKLIFNGGTWPDGKKKPGAKDVLTDRWLEMAEDVYQIRYEELTDIPV